MKRSIDIKITNVTKEEAIQNLEDIINDLKEESTEFNYLSSIFSGHPYKWEMKLHDNDD